jgi:hypothetical protein
MLSFSCVTRRARAEWVRRLLTASPILLAAILLFSVLTPEPLYDQGYSGSGIPVLVESDSNCAACGNPIVAIAHYPLVQFLPLVEQVHHFPSLITLTNPFYRGPPFCET